MDKHLIEALVIIVAVVTSRVLSRLEHRKSKKEGAERGNKLDTIYLMMNGELQKRVDEAYQRGKQDQIKTEKGL